MLHLSAVGLTDMAKTPLRAIRVPDDEWEPAQAVAAENGETVTDVVRRALVAYVTPVISCLPVVQ